MRSKNDTICVRVRAPRPSVKQYLRTHKNPIQSEGGLTDVQLVKNIALNKMSIKI